MDGGELGIRNDLRWAVGIPTGTESAAYLFKVRSLASQRLRTRERLPEPFWMFTVALESMLNFRYSGQHLNQYWGECGVVFGLQISNH